MPRPELELKGGLVQEEAEPAERDGAGSRAVTCSGVTAG